MQYFLRANEHTYEISPPEEGEGSWLDQGAYGLSVHLSSIHRSKVSGYDVTRLDSEGYNDLYGYDDIEAGQPAHIIVVEYTDGDTFGSSGYWCVPAVKRDADEALAIVKRCEGANDLERGYRPWDGYFARLEGARVDTLIVSP